MKSDLLRELLRIVEATEPVELDCDELLARVGVLVERSGGSDAVVPEIRALRQHLQICGECMEEFEALMRFYGISPGPNRS